MAPRLPRPYAAAVLDARRAVLSIDRTTQRAIARSLEQYADELAALVRSAGTGLDERRALEASERIVRQAAARLRTSLVDATGRAREMSVRDTLEIWQDAQREIAKRAHAGVRNALLGSIETGNVVQTSAFASLSRQTEWRTILGGHVSASAGEARALIRQALITTEWPEQLARKLRKYVAGGDPAERIRLQRWFDEHGVDLRKVPRELQGAAAQTRYNAERIAFSETHNARAEAEVAHFAADPLVASVQWELSPNRGTQKVPDICDVLAVNDFYGHGRGRYPVAKVPPSPHPWDRCERVPVIPDLEELEAANQLTGRAGLRLTPDAAMIPRSELLTPAAIRRIRQQLAELLVH